ncbi:DUF58 domain-containing protein [Rubrivirga sp. S365]|uniref:DUF58 domain-containing protein n=1 Tax=Rubrivirga litoralis TaxID=3075598 RepID=A0ABU3BSY2_9BACT|nr:MULTISPECIES: DUF58 domain-containing protein [unclassified Rubrivirga]MDT0632394.1 DUF58 domain-containing protein [Rubrivirga sp. F394]MDT7855235.1 DUF58 domain-containing protein [Rubrivirga sp. S365]
MIPRELFRKIRHVEVRTRGLVDDVFGGEYHSAFKGRGIEFAEVRPYQVGDDVRTIDWNVSARTGEPHVKLFEEEREQTLLLVVDVSGSEDFGSGEGAKRDLAAEVCAVLGFSALRNSDKVGLVLFTDRVERFVPPRKGRRHVLRLLRDLFAHEAEHRGTSLDDALDHVLRVQRRRAIVILVSDFLVPDDADLARRLRVVAQKHDVVAVRLVDPREEALPAVGLLRVVDAETGRPALVDTSSARVRRAFADRAAARAARAEATLRQARVDHVTLRTDEDYVEPLSAFFRRRVRGMR